MARVLHVAAEARSVAAWMGVQVSELSHKLGAAEGAKRALDDEVARIKAVHTALAAAKHEQDIALNEAKAKVLALEEKTTSQADVIEQARSRLRDLEAAARQWEARCSDLRDSAAAADVRAKDAQAEVLKGNAIIEKLSVSAGPCTHARRAAMPCHAGPWLNMPNPFSPACNAMK